MWWSVAKRGQNHGDGCTPQNIFGQGHRLRLSHSWAIGDCDVWVVHGFCVGWAGGEGRPDAYVAQKSTSPSLLQKAPPPLHETPRPGHFGLRDARGRAGRPRAASKKTRQWNEKAFLQGGRERRKKRESFAKKTLPKTRGPSREKDHAGILPAALCTLVCLAREPSGGRARTIEGGLPDRMVGRGPRLLRRRGVLLPEDFRQGDFRRLCSWARTAAHNSVGKVRGGPNPWLLRLLGVYLGFGQIGQGTSSLPCGQRGHHRHARTDTFSVPRVFGDTRPLRAPWGRQKRALVRPQGLVHPLHPPRHDHHVPTPSPQARPRPIKQRPARERRTKQPLFRRLAP